jgi:ABC-type glutathione transport system ATPase component
LYDLDPRKSPPNKSDAKPKSNKAAEEKGDAEEKTELQAATEAEAKPESKEPTQCLWSIDLEVGDGELVGVAGAVGSGKSALVAAIMGEVSCCKMGWTVPNL